MYDPFCSICNMLIESNKAVTIDNFFHKIEGILLKKSLQKQIKNRK